MDRSGSRWAIYTAIICFDGSLEYGPVKILETGRHLKRPELVYNSRNREMILFWQQSQGRNNYYDIFARNLYDGTSQYSKNIKVSNITGSHENPALVFDQENNQIFVVWEHWWLGSGNRRILGAIVKGSASVTSMLLAQNGFHPRVAWDSVRGDYLAVWNSVKSGSQVIEGAYVSPSTGYDTTVCFKTEPFVLARGQVGNPDTVSYTHLRAHET